MGEPEKIGEFILKHKKIIDILILILGVGTIIFILWVWFKYRKKGEEKK